MAQKRIVKSSSEYFNKKLDLKSNIPIDKGDCVCRNEIIKYLKDPLKKKYITCPHKTTGYNHYKIVCNNCKEIVAYVWSKNKKMEDYFDLHYSCRVENNQWFGCMALNISPYDGKIGIECCCGNDTRDFRGNTTLPFNMIKNLVKLNLEGRDFGLIKSKFSLIKL